MQQTFYEYLKPSLWLCNIFGISYNVSKKKHAGCNLQNIASFILAIQYFGTHFFFLAYMVFIEAPAANNYYHYFTNVMRISNKIGVIFGPLFVYSKGIYYFLKRKALQDLLLEVRVKHPIPTFVMIR